MPPILYLSSHFPQQLQTTLWSSFTQPHPSHFILLFQWASGWPPTQPHPSHFFILFQWASRGPVDDLPSNLTHLTFGCNFNQPVDKLLLSSHFQTKLQPTSGSSPSQSHSSQSQRKIPSTIEPPSSIYHPLCFDLGTSTIIGSSQQPDLPWDTKHCNIRWYVWVLLNWLFIKRMWVFVWKFHT